MKNVFYGLMILSVVAISSCGDDDDGSTTIPIEPEIVLNANSLDFGTVEEGQTSSALSVTVSGNNLEGDVVVSIPDNYEASLSESGTYEAESITLAQSSFDDEASVSLFIRVVVPASFEGTVSGTATFQTLNGDDVDLSLTAASEITITGQLFMSEYFEQYGAEFQDLLPVDSAILMWSMNTDTVVNQANAGGGYPETTIPNNEVVEIWHVGIPLNGASLRSTLGFNASTSLAVSGYPAAPAGARSIRLDDEDMNTFENWVNRNNGNCQPSLPANQPLSERNIGCSRRFALDGYTDDVFMSALVNISELGDQREGKSDDFGRGDLLMLTSALTGPANNNNVKVLALSNGAGGFNFGLNKENEGNANILSTESYSLNTTYVVVLSHEFVAGDNNDITNLYIFEEGDQIPTSVDGLTPVATMDDTYTDGIDPIDLTEVFIRERNLAVICPTAEITGIRVGSTWVATLFEDAANAVNSNDITANNRILTNEGSDCTP
ncbi:MAG: hypothetical protein AAF519_07370 [Bacteroidota bacterium]